MSLSAKVYANSDNTVFYNANLQVVLEIHDLEEWNPHYLNQYKKDDFLGVTTGNVKQIGDENLIEIWHTYDHQYKAVKIPVAFFIPVSVGSKWKSRTVALYVPEKLITTEAPLTPEQKKALEDQQKLKLLDKYNPKLSGNGDGNDGSGTSNIVVYVVVAVLLVGTLIWAFFGGKKKPAPPPNVVVLPKNRKLQNLPPSTPSAP